MVFALPAFSLHYLLRLVGFTTAALCHPFHWFGPEPVKR
jgi:hypothetical protein